MFGVDHDRFAYVTAMKYAFELINNRTDILPDYHLEAEYHDTIGSTAVAILKLMHIMDVNCSRSPKIPPGILGPAFSKVTIPVGEALTLMFTLQFTYAATSPVLDDRSQFPYLVRTVPGTNTLNRANIALMKRFGWKRVGIFYDHHAHDGIFAQVTENLIKKVKENNFSVVEFESVHAGTPELATSDEDIRLRLEKLKAADIKIIFGMFRWTGAYRIFCQAYKLEMYGKNYVWILHPRAETVDKWLTAPTRGLSTKTDCSEEQYRKVGDRIIFIDQQKYREDSEKTISGLTVAEYQKYIFDQRIKQPCDKPYENITSHAYGFDSVWILASTLNHCVPELRKINRSLDNLTWQDHRQVNVLKKCVFKVNFEGLTGQICFHDASTNRMGIMTMYQVRGRNVVSVGRFAAVNEALDLKPEAYKDMWIDGKVPKDISLRETILLNLPIPLYTTMCTIAGLGIISAIGVLIFNIYNRNVSYIKHSAPMFNNLIIFGIMLCLSTVFIFGLPIEIGETEKFLLTCKLRSWILCLGFSLSFGSMFVKTWRVYKIFTNRKLKYSLERLSNKSLFLMVAGIVAVDLIVLTLWEFIDPIETKISSFPTEADPHDSNKVLVPILYTCYSRHQDTWVTTIYSIKGILLLYGLFLAYETRNVMFEHLNDSRMIGVCVYNVAVMAVLGGLLRIILSEVYYRESFGITAVCIIFPSLGTLFLIFLPKVVRFVKKDDVNRSGVVIEGPVARNGNNFHLRKDSIDSDVITSVSSSYPCSASPRITPIYAEAVTTETNNNGDSPPDKNDLHEAES